MSAGEVLQTAEGDPHAGLRPELWEEFAAATGDGAERGDARIAAALKRALSRQLDADFRDGAPGDVAAERRARAMDFALGRLLRDRTDIAAIAVGGYGRGLLAPHSDVDLLFLARTDPAAVRSSLEGALYAMWDAGLVVGNVSHGVKGAVAACRNDLVACSSFLDARFVAGDRGLFVSFADGYDSWRRRSARKFTNAKLAELSERRREHDRVGRNLEPNLKEARGGLRDFDVVGWIYRYLTGVDAWSQGGLVDLIGEDDAERLKRARRHLWSVRAHLHDIVGRADDQATFDVQPALAARLGYADRRRASAAERLMKHLRLNAMTANRLNRIALARLDEKTAALSHWRPRATPSALLADELQGRVNVTVRTNRLDFASKASARATPADLFRLFRARARRTDLDLHPDAIELVSTAARRLTEAVREDRDIARLFLAMMETARDPLPVLLDMRETGLLGAYLPYLRRVTGQVEYGLYRRYSIEEQVLRSLDAFAGVRFGTLGDAHPIAASLMRRKGPRQAALIAILLQETTWAAPDRSIEDAERAARRLARRFLDDERQVADAAWSAAHPDRLIEVAERRNIGADETILDFAADVGTVARLETLLILTVCRHLVVSENRWNPWTRRQVGALYFGARAALAGGAGALAAFRREEEEALGREIALAMPDWTLAESNAFGASLAREGAARLPAPLLARGARLLAAVRSSGERISVDVRPTDAGFEAVATAPDREGLLADIAAGVGEAGVDVRLVHAMSLDGQALDFFMLGPAQAVRASDTERDEIAARIGRSMRARAATRGAPAVAPSPRLGDRRSLFEVEPSVRLEADASPGRLIVETEGRDRPGLLADLAGALAGAGCSIRSAHIATYGAQAVDVFYVTPAAGGERFRDEALREIETRLMAVLTLGD